MRFSVILCALTTLVATAAATPVHALEERQAPPAGTAILKCKKAGTVAITFDDGPFTYTEQALNLLKAANMKATFFVNGENWSKLSAHTNTLKRMINEKHQIGSHTWSHPDLTKQSAANVKSQMTKLEVEMRRLIGRYPTYMRPPYFAYNAATLKSMKDLGYKVVIADIDTNDWQNNPTKSFTAFVDGLKKKGSIVLAHDVHKSTVQTLLPKMIAEIKKRKLKAVTVGECLGDPAANWYKTTPRK